MNSTMHEKLVQASKGIVTAINLLQTKERLQRELTPKPDTVKKRVLEGVQEKLDALEPLNHMSILELRNLHIYLQRLLVGLVDLQVELPPEVTLLETLNTLGGAHVA